MLIKVQHILKYLEQANLKFKYEGDSQLEIQGFSPISQIKSKTITWIKKIEDIEGYDFTKVEGILVVCNEFDCQKYKDVSFIFCEDPKELFFSILKEFFKQKEYKDYISPKSVVETKHIGKGVYIGHNSFVGEDVTIGDNVVIKNNVTIEGKVTIGKNTIIHSGVVIGTDGYGYFQDSEGKNQKVPHYGGVVIGEDVEIGANTCIDRGTLGDTLIGNNVKIDNLCHIAHNVVIKENCSVIAMSVIAGSVVLEKNAYIAPGVIVKNQLTVGENSLVGLGAVVLKDVEKNKVMAGVPAKVIKEL